MSESRIERSWDRLKRLARRPAALHALPLGGELRARSQAATGTSSPTLRKGAERRPCLNTHRVGQIARLDGRFWASA